ncbi:MAG: class I SAM-dependent DNA methyltransferase [Pseudonocardiaceae bacterium]
MAGDADPPGTTVPHDHFDRLYADKPDPWNLATSWYERRKYALTVASLPKAQYDSGFELGCAIGELTRLLASRCEQLLAVDCAARAVTQARRAVAEFGQVQVKRANLPADLPQGRHDLIVASEILYYFCAADLDQLLRGLADRLEPGGDIVAVHHRARDRCYGYDGYNVHCTLTSRPELTRLVHHEDEHFVLDVLRRRKRHPSR